MASLGNGISSNGQESSDSRFNILERTFEQFQVIIFFIFIIFVSFYFVL